MAALIRRTQTYAKRIAHKGIWIGGMFLQRNVAGPMISIDQKFRQPKQVIGGVRHASVLAEPGHSQIQNRPL